VVELDPGVDPCTHTGQFTSLSLSLPGRLETLLQSQAHKSGRYRLHGHRGNSVRGQDIHSGGNTRCSVHNRHVHLTAGAGCHKRCTTPAQLQHISQNTNLVAFAGRNTQPYMSSTTLTSTTAMNRFTITMLPNTMNDRKYTGAYGEWARAAYSTFSQLSTVAHRVRVTRAAPKVRKVLWGLSKLSCPPKKLTPAQTPQAQAHVKQNARFVRNTRGTTYTRSNLPSKTYFVLWEGARPYE